MTSPVSAPATSSAGAARSSNRRVRWNPTLGEFELQCPKCRDAYRASFWPITVEYWQPWRPSRCRACWLEYDRTKQRERRQKPEVRARDNAATAAWRDRHPGYNAATAALWRKLNPERKREQDRAYHARKKAA